LKGNFVHINDEAIEHIIENSLFDFDVWLGLGKEVERSHKPSVAPWESVKDQKTRNEKSTDGKNRDGDKKLIKTYSRSFEGDNFTIL
jgi:hypothetical protein